MENKINIGITEQNRKEVANQLSKLLANEYVLYTKTRRAHWNVTGIDFYDKHKLFEDQYNQINEYIDDVAERIRTLGEFPPASLTAFISLAEIKEITNSTGEKSQILIEQLLIDHEIIINYIRNIIAPINDEFKDVGTADFLTSLLEEHEKMAWILRSHL